MDLNLVYLSGELAAAPDLRTFDSGARLARYLVSVRTSTPRRRLDVVPVTLWEPTEDHLAAPALRGTPVWVAAQIQRRFWSGTDGREGRLEVVAHQVMFHDPGEAGGVHLLGAGASVTGVPLDGVDAATDDG